MGIGLVRIGKVAMATIGTVWTVSNAQLLYKQAKLLLLPASSSSSSYTFLFFHVILLSVLFQYSSLASFLKHLLPNFKPAQSTPLHLETQLSRSFSGIWHRITAPKEDHGPTMFEEYSEYKVEEAAAEQVQMEEEDEEGTMEETWNAIMEGKKRAQEKELKKSSTWGATPTIDRDHMRGTLSQLKPSRSLKVEENEEEDKGGKRALLSRDELNLRAEEFITKIKNNIRLERLQSYNLFLQLINRPST